MSTDNVQIDSQLRPHVPPKYSTILLRVYVLASYGRITHHTLLIRRDVHIHTVCACIFTLFVYTSCYWVSCIDYAYLQDGLTPLMLAAQFGNLSVAELLVENYKCDVNEKSDEKVSGKYNERSE